MQPWEAEFLGDSVIKVPAQANLVILNAKHLVG